MTTATVLKVGGAELQEGPTLDALLDVLVSLANHGDLVVVHGGGPEIAEMQAQLGLQPRFMDGLRVTDAASLRVAEMVLSGLINKRLTGRLVGRQVRALGISGVDSGLLRARRLEHAGGDLGFVGEIVSVNVGCLRDLLAQGYTPIVSPISLGEDGSSYNVNADHAALAIASALPADELVFLTNVPGVQNDGALLQALSASEAKHLIAQGIITGGMIPKVRSALRAVDRGVPATRITDLAGLSTGSGTVIKA